MMLQSILVATLYTAALTLLVPEGWLMTAASLCLATLLSVIAVIDLRRLRIPDAANLALALCGLATTGTLAPASLTLHVIVASVTAGLLYAISEGYFRWRRRDGLGLGDVKLAGAAALWIGPGIATAVLIAASLALLVGALSALKDRASLSQPMPFGPFLAGAILVVWFRT